MNANNHIFFQCQCSLITHVDMVTYSIWSFNWVYLVFVKKTYIVGQQRKKWTLYEIVLCHLHEIKNAIFCVQKMVLVLPVAVVTGLSTPGTKFGCLREVLKARFLKQNSTIFSCWLISVWNKTCFCVDMVMLDCKLFMECSFLHVYYWRRHVVLLDITLQICLWLI